MSSFSFLPPARSSFPPFARVLFEGGFDSEKLENWERKALTCSLIELVSQVVIIDEAHNLIDSILSLHSISITLSQITQIRQALLTYIQKFRKKFTGLNSVYLKEFAVVLKGLSEVGEGCMKGGKREEMVQVGKLFERGGGATGRGGSNALDQINLRKLDEYLQRSKIARKVSSFLVFDD